MRKPLLLVFLVPVLAACGSVATESLPPAHAASPQHVDLDWVESIGDASGHVVFGVRSLDVTNAGWRASISLRNDTSVPFATEFAGIPGSRDFGLMLFSTGAHSELERRNVQGTLPTVRRAETTTPALPAELGAHATWTGTISAEGPIAAGTWARVVFGTLVPTTVVTKSGDTPAGPEPTLPEALTKANVQGGLTWITDHAYELRR